MFATMTAFCLQFGLTCLPCDKVVSHEGSTLTYKTCCCTDVSPVLKNQNRWTINEANLREYSDMRFQ